MSLVSTYRKRLFRAGLAAVLTAAGLTMMPLAHAGQMVPRDAAGELLRNAHEALADNQPAEARQFFERLIELYPQSPAAAAARSEMDRMEAGELPEDEAPARRTAKSRAVADEASRKLKRAFIVEVGDKVFFAENSSEIGGRARSVIESQARWLKLRPDLNITVIGRADDGGSAANAGALSKARAEAVRDKLVESGLPAARIAVEGRGEKDPVATCRSALCQAENRHVETAIAFASAASSSAIQRDEPLKDVSASQHSGYRPLTR